MHAHRAGHYENPDETSARLGGAGVLGPNATSTGAAPGATPVIAGAGTGASASITGTDNAGLANLTTGTGPAPGQVARVAFATPYAVPPNVVLMPQNNNAAGVSNLISVQADANGFFISSSGPLTAATMYSWYYIVLG